MGGKRLKVGMLDILLEVASGRINATAISEHINLPQSTIQDRLRNLEKEGFLTSYKAFNKRCYELSSTGNRAITEFRDPSKEDARKLGKVFAHKVAWSMKIAREPAWLREELEKTGFIAGMHRNWLSLNREFDDHTISFHKNRVFVYFTEFSLDKGPIDYYPVASEKMAKIKSFLENQFKGLVLTDPRQHAKYRIHDQHIVEKYGDVALRFAKVRQETGQKVVYHGKNFHVDFSRGPPEQEFVNKTGAVADALAYAEFVDGFCEAPFRAKDIKEQSSKIESINEEVLGVQDGIKAILQEGKSTKESLKDLTDSFIKTSNSQSEYNRSLTALQEQQTGSMAIFAKAMDEHVALVKELQEVTKQLGEGFKALQNKKPWIIRVWEGLKKMFQRKQRRVG
jgi:predicted transcriptional regulator